MSKHKILILGGTQMLGRDLVETLLNQNETDLILANRGITNPYLFPNIEKIYIDRNDTEHCSNLKAYDFETIIDFSCYNIQQWMNVHQHLNKYQKYILISTQSVFDIEYINNPNKNPVYGQYCIDKKNLENFILTQYTYQNIIIVRPCAVYGEHDYTGRFEKRNNTWYYKHTDSIATETLQCVDVKVVTQTILEILDSNNPKSIYNITNQCTY